MGAWGTGNFENDGALDFVGGLSADAFAAVHLEDSAEVDATASAHAPAAAEFVAAARGHLADDFPRAARGLTKSLKATDLKELACDAVSRVLIDSELIELPPHSGRILGNPARPRSNFLSAPRQ